MSKSWIAKLAAKLALRVFRTTVTGTDKLLTAHASASGKVLVTANHVSLLDGVLIALSSPIPMIYAVDTEYALQKAIPRLGLGLLSAMGFGKVIPLDGNSFYGIRTLCRELAQGNSVMIFPEGNIRAATEVQKLKPGRDWLARMAEATEFTITIRGAENSRLFSKAGNHFWPPISLEYGESWLKGNQL